jgi:hypothetical protein
MSRGALERAAKIIFLRKSKIKNRKIGNREKAKSRKAIMSGNFDGENPACESKHDLNLFKPPRSAESWQSGVARFFFIARLIQ